MRKQRAMLAAFAKFQERMAARYQEVYDALEEERYKDAERLLASITMSHAKTSLSLRGVLIRDGKIKETK